MTEGSKSAFQTAITVKEVVDKIHSKKYLLPAIQREFVWSQKQIIRLFDSLMKKYTIGSFLFWKVEQDKVPNYDFYEFIREYHQRDRKRNPKAREFGEGSVMSILDGQQRLTSLYIGLRGTYATKLPRKRRANDRAFPERKLYINLLSKSKDFDLMYDFQFLTDRRAKQQTNEKYWFEVGKILKFEKLSDINIFVNNSGLETYGNTAFATDVLSDLYEAIHRDGVINYYLETSQELEKVLSIFIRVNSGGTQLSYSDLLLSFATTQWKTKDARDEITSFVDYLNRIGNGFRFNKDNVLKSCLFLSDISNIAFKVVNFTKKNMAKIEEKWESIRGSLGKAVELVSAFGYDRYTLTSTNAILPIAYYILQKGNPHNMLSSEKYYEDRNYINKWLRRALLRRSFSGQPDNVLLPIRTIIKENPASFPLTKIVERFRKHPTKSFIFTEDDIDNLLNTRYDRGYAFSVLSILDPDFNFGSQFDIDHLYPQSFFTKKVLREKGIPENKWGFYRNQYHLLSNLQLLERTKNIGKGNTDFEVWINKQDATKREGYMRRKYVPTGIDLGFKNFEQFFIKRRELLREELTEKLML